MATGFYSQRRTLRDPVRNLVAFFAVISVLGACQAGPAAQPVTTPVAELTPTISASSTSPTVESPGPTLAAAPTTALSPVATTAISVGGTEACALHAGGHVACWVLGASSTATVPGAADPTAISDATAISAGQSHDCAIESGGGVQCWGNNTYGTLGDGTTSSRMTPVPVSGLTNAIAIAAGDNHTCTIRSGGSVLCWGLNDEGALGNGEKLTVHNISTPHSLAQTPVPVSGLTDATAIAVGNDYTCAVRSAGSVVCWGVGLFLGAGALPPSGGLLSATSIPVPVSGIADATTITADNWHTCVLLAVGSVKCWGSNWFGELGAGPPPGPLSRTLTPVSLPGITDATSIAAGFDHTCALRSGGSVVCWGGNSVGQLGDGTTADSLIPVPVSGIADATAIDAGFQYTCILRSDGSIKCWGQGSLVPVNVTFDGTGL